MRQQKSRKALFFRRILAMKNKSDYVKVASYEAQKGEVKKVILLYSGGLDTSVILKWIQEEYQTKVIALTIDIGQQAEDLKKIRQKALKLGALKALVIDAKDEFADDYISKGIKANADYQKGYHLATPIGRPLLAKWAVEIAEKEGADAIAHGCTGKGNDQVRIEGTALALNPNIKIIAPVREWSLGRDEELKYAEKHDISVTQTAERIYSYDDNMWGISAEGGEIENPELAPPLEKILQVCRLVEKAPKRPEKITIEFFKGIPVRLNKKLMKLSDLIIALNKKAAKHGIGVSVHIEDRVVGLKIRNVYEMPAAVTIIEAHRNLEKYVSTRWENKFKPIIDNEWAYMCYSGLWYDPLMDNLNAYIDSVNQKVTGKVTIELYKGVARVVSLKAPSSIFDEKLATFMKSELFNQNASPGFIELWTLQMKMAKRAERCALLSIGKLKNKKRLLSVVKSLAELGFKLFATKKTHKFLKKNKIRAVFLNKIGEKNKKPNINDYLDQQRFDLIINIPTDSKKREKTDGQIIREKAIQSKAVLVTEPQVAKALITKLKKSK